MHAFMARSRTEEDPDHAAQSPADHDEHNHDKHNSAEVRLLHSPKYSEVNREQGIPYKEFLHIKRTVNGLAGSMSNLERNMDRLAKSLESLERSNASASSSKQSSTLPPVAPFPNFPEQRTGLPNRREADELFVKV